MVRERFARLTFAEDERMRWALLAGATVRWPQVRIGSYPRFLPDGPEVEIVLKSSDEAALAEAVAWIEPALEGASAPAQPPG